MPPPPLLHMGHRPPLEESIQTRRQRAWNRWLHCVRTQFPVLLLLLVSSSACRQMGQGSPFEDAGSVTIVSRCGKRLWQSIIRLTPSSIPNKWGGLLTSKLRQNTVSFRCTLSASAPSSVSYIRGSFGLIESTCCDETVKSRTRRMAYRWTELTIATGGLASKSS